MKEASVKLERLSMTKLSRTHDLHLISEIVRKELKGPGWCACSFFVLTDSDNHFRYISLLHMIPTGVYIFKYKPGSGAGFNVLWMKMYIDFTQLFPLNIFFNEELKKNKIIWPEKWFSELNIHPCLIKNDVSTIDPSELWCQLTVSWFNTFCAYPLKSCLVTELNYL